jgi:cholesterol oxidase
VTLPQLNRAPIDVDGAPAPSQNGAGLVFRETMTGWFATGMHDPVAGAQAGRARGTALRVRATMQIPDLPAFERDTEHSGIIGGHVDFGAIGQNMRTSRGELCLFSPDDGGGRQMRYSLAFHHDGESYFLSGWKHLSGESLTRAWWENTAVYARLHRGFDTRCPVLAAGILRVDVLSLFGALSTLRGTGGSRMERLSAPFRFGKFYAGELWASYIGSRARPERAD